MGGQLGDWVNDLAKGFNESQKEYKVVPTFKGSYPETLTAGIAAFRSGNRPDILQVFEVGTATMMASKGAIMPVYKLMADRREVRSKAYVPAVGATTPRRRARCCRSRSTARRRSSITTRTPSRPPASIPRSRPPPGPKSRSLPPS